MNLKVIKLYGTHHLLEKKKIEEAIKVFKPDAVCVELDKIRFDKLSNPEEAKKDYSKDLSWFSRMILKKIKDKSTNIAKDTNQEYGGDMIGALQYCAKKKIPCKLIDMGVIEIAKGFDKLNWKEKLILYVMINYGKKVDINQVNKLNQESVKSNLENMKVKFPNLYDHLVVARDRFMANKIMDLAKLDEYNRILIFVGHGHVEGIKQHLNRKGFVVKE